MGKIYRIRAQDIGRFMRRVQMLVCYRCGVELVAREWVFSKASRGDCSVNTAWASEKQGGCTTNRRLIHLPKVYHLKCAKEVHLC